MDLDQVLYCCVARVIEFVASSHEEPWSTGSGFVTASVLDPFGQRPWGDVNQRCLSVLAGR